MIILSSLLIFLFTTPVYAIEKGEVSISAHYVHPINGTIEDPGNNEAIGQGMTESVLDREAQYTVDDNGNIFLTLKLHLANEIGDISFSIQNRGEQDFYKVQHEILKQEGDTIFVKVPVSNLDDVLRLTIYVHAMGRSVIFYGLLDNAIVTSHQEDNARDKEMLKNEQTTIVKSGTSKNQNNTKSSKADRTNKSAATLGEKITSKGNISQTNEDIFPEHHGLLTKDSPEILAKKGFQDQAPWGPWTRALVTAFLVSLSFLLVISVCAAIGIVLFWRYFRYQNDRREAELYALEDKKNL